MSSPTGEYIPRFIRTDDLPLNEKAGRKLNGIMQKLSPSNFDALVEQARSIKVFAEEAFPVTNEATETMKPIVGVIIKNIKICNENDAQNDIYAKMFCDLSKSWNGNQGTIFTSLVNNELWSILNEYSAVAEISEEYKLQIYSVVAFIARLYKHDGVSGLFVIRTLELFCKKGDNNIPVFAKLLLNTFDKLSKEAWFKGKLVNKYHQFVKDYVEEGNSGIVHFLMVQLLEKKWPN